MIDLTALAKRKAAAEKKQEMQAARTEILRSAWATVITEMNSLYGPFDIETELGVAMLPRFFRLITRPVRRASFTTGEENEIYLLLGRRPLDFSARTGI